MLSLVMFVSPHTYMYIHRIVKGHGVRASDSTLPFRVDPTVPVNGTRILNKTCLHSSEHGKHCITPHALVNLKLAWIITPGPVLYQFLNHSYSRGL